MAVLFKELVFLAILASALTFPWKPNGLDFAVDDPPGKEIYPVETDKRGKDSADDEPPIEVYPVETNPSGSKRSEAENKQVRREALRSFLNRREHLLPAPDREDVYPLETLSPKRGKDSADDEPPIEAEYPAEDNRSESKHSEAENSQVREKGLRSFLNRRGHLLPAPNREDVYPLDNLPAKRAPVYGNSYRESDSENNKNGKRGAVSNTYRWPKSSAGTVDITYYFASSLNSDAQKWAKTVIHQLAQDTCINLVEGSADNHEVEFTSGSGCSSLIGHQQDTQSIILGSGCQYRGTIAHEIMHLLGFFHEHTRQDRDQYITVHDENILSGYSTQFAERSQNNFGYQYDKHSIMQYSNTAFGTTLSDGTKASTMDSISNPSETLGAVSHMDANDLGKINAFYECSNAPSFVDHIITLSTQANSWFSCCHGTDGFVYVQLVGTSGTTPWQLVTSGGKVYADENEGGDVQTHHVPFPDVGTITAVRVALVAEGNIKTRKRRSLETKTKRLFDGWTLQSLELDGVSYGGGELDTGEELTLK